MLRITPASADACEVRVPEDVRSHSAVWIGPVLLGLLAVALLVPAPVGQGDRPAWALAAAQSRRGDPVVAAALREATLVGLEPILEVPLAELARTWAAAGDAPVRVMAVPDGFALARSRAVQASEPGVSPLAFALGWLLLRSPASRRPRPFR